MSCPTSLKLGHRQPAVLATRLLPNAEQGGFKIKSLYQNTAYVCFGDTKGAVFQDNPFPYHLIKFKIRVVIPTTIADDANHMSP